jgi:hypothetical protein
LGSGFRPLWVERRGQCPDVLLIAGLGDPAEACKGGHRREVGMDDWGWEHLSAWSSRRLELPPGPLFCIIDGPTRGRPWP